MHEEQLNQLKVLYSEQQGELNDLQASLKSLEEKRELVQNDVLVCSEKDRSAESNIRRLNEESASNKEKNIELLAQIRSYDSDISSLKPQLDNQLKKYKSKKLDFDKIQKRYEDAQSDLEAIQNNRWEAQQKFSNDRSLLDKAQSLIEEKNKVIDRLITKVRNVELEHNERSTEEKYLNKKKLEQEKIVNKADTKLSNARISLSDFSEELNRLCLLYTSPSPRDRG